MGKQWLQKILTHSKADYSVPQDPAGIDNNTFSPRRDLRMRREVEHNRLQSQMRPTWLGSHRLWAWTHPAAARRLRHLYSAPEHTPECTSFYERQLQEARRILHPRPMTTPKSPTSESQPNAGNVSGEGYGRRTAQFFSFTPSRRRGQVYNDSWGRGSFWARMRTGNTPGRSRPGTATSRLGTSLGRSGATLSRPDASAIREIPPVPPVPEVSSFGFRRSVNLAELALQRPDLEFPARYIPPNVLQTNGLIPDDPDETSPANQSFPQWETPPQLLPFTSTTTSTHQARTYQQHPGTQYLATAESQIDYSVNGKCLTGKQSEIDDMVNQKRKELDQAQTAGTVWVKSQFMDYYPSQTPEKNQQQRVRESTWEEAHERLDEYAVNYGASPTAIRTRAGRESFVQVEKQRLLSQEKGARQNIRHDPEEWNETIQRARNKLELLRKNEEAFVLGEVKDPFTYDQEIQDLFSQAAQPPQSFLTTVGQHSFAEPTQQHPARPTHRAHGRNQSVSTTAFHAPKHGFNMDRQPRNDSAHNASSSQQPQNQTGATSIVSSVAVNRTDVPVVENYTTYSERLRHRFARPPLPNQNQPEPRLQSQVAFFGNPGPAKSTATGKDNNSDG